GRPSSSMTPSGVGAEGWVLAEVSGWRSESGAAFAISGASLEDAVGSDGSVCAVYGADYDAEGGTRLEIKTSIDQCTNIRCFVKSNL
ncbi:MAG: hypothetical protein QNJ46_34580, partial [Leptolyngbyaceae cyanobacterium MO_188.B28]|nr:hypothetical protein [Leptolyngbyaceae cyanobacterium MO_188.B28]